MFRQNMTSPISVLLAGVVMIFLLLASAGGNTSAITRQQSGTPTWTPCHIDDNACIDFQDEATASAYPIDTATATTSAYEAPGTNTSEATGTATATGTSAVPQILTPTQATPTPTRAANLDDTAEPPAETAQPGEAMPTVSPTPTDALACMPGVPLEIAGDGPPRAPLLLYFAERPVGGGSVAANGRFALKLIVGQERAGEYSVTVRVRGTSQVLRQLTCSVPNVTPTPLPGAPER